MTSIAAALTLAVTIVWPGVEWVGLREVQP
jgi:hypothetical protein